MFSPITPLKHGQKNLLHKGKDMDDFPKILDGTASALQLKVPFMICLGMGKTCDFKMPITKKWETS